MAYSEVEFTYTGGPQVFPTNFALGVLESEHIVVTVDGQVDGLGDPIEFAFTYDAGTGEVTVTDALTVGWTGKIKRVTPVTTLIVDFGANADVTKRNLSRSTKQVLMVVQELTDSREADSIAVQDTLEIVSELQADIEDDLATIEADRIAAALSASQAAASAAEALAKENSMLRDRGPWATLTLYSQSDLFTDNGSAYITQVAHIASSIAADLGAGRIRVFAAKGASGAGAGDMNNADNLNFLTNKPLALSTIGGQPSDADLTAIAALGGTGIAVRTAADTWAQRQITSTDNSVTITNPAGVAGNIDLSVATGGVSAAIAANSGTAIDIGSIPAAATRGWILFSAVSLNGSDDLLVQIGDSGGIENTGYISGSRETASSSTAGFIMFLGNAARAATGIMELVKGAGNQWFASHSIYSPTISSSGGGSKTLSDTLDRVRIIPSGANSFDGAGTITVRWA